MPEKVRWGILGAARIATAKVIPAMQRGAWSEVTAIASRDIGKAHSAAAALGIPKAYGSYEELIADPEIDAIYNPLPNHLHVPWSIRAAEAGKHVLCEKPISMTVAECRKLIDVRNRTGVKIGDGFMVRTHPQWLRAREIVRSGEIGDLRAVMVAFSYFNRDPANIRNIEAVGGGALMDIGCYAIQFSRFLFEQEPVRVAGLLERDPEMRTDRLASALLDFPSGQAVFTCSTQLAPYQRAQLLGVKGRIEVQIPVNTPPDRVSRIWIDSGTDLFGSSARLEEFPPCDQYTIQGDLFSMAVRGEGDVPTPLEDSIRNMAVIEALFRSARDNAWVTPEI
jgi:predicted dehydrogenase